MSTGTPLAAIRRSLQITAALAPLVPQMAAMGQDRARRERMGASLRHSAVELGGVYPWIADLIEQVPALAGPSISSGIRTRSVDDGLTSLLRADSRLGDGEVVVRPALRRDLLETDIGLLRLTVKLLRPLTGQLSSELVEAASSSVADQIRAEASVEDELAHRARLRGNPAVLVVDAEPAEGGYRERPHPAFAIETTRDGSTLKRLVAAWADLVTEHGCIPSTISWGSSRVDYGGRTVLRRVGGTIDAPDLHRQLVTDLRAAHGLDAAATIGRICEVASVELGAAPEAEGIAGVALVIAGFVYGPGVGATLGPLAVLRRLSAAAREADRPVVCSRAFLQLTRQLATFRSMADEVGIEGSPFERCTG